jgi:hypothetical protein
MAAKDIKMESRILRAAHISYVLCLSWASADQIMLMEE